MIPKAKKKSIFIFAKIRFFPVVFPGSNTLKLNIRVFCINFERYVILLREEFKKN